MGKLALDLLYQPEGYHAPAGNRDQYSLALPHGCLSGKRRDGAIGLGRGRMCSRVALVLGQLSELS
jgi:hypothetical protein